MSEPFVIDANRPETYLIAKNAGDRTFLRWMADRLVYVYGENPDIDFVRVMRDFAEKFDPAPPVPSEDFAGLVNHLTAHALDLGEKKSRDHVSFSNIGMLDAKRALLAYGARLEGEIEHQSQRRFVEWERANKAEAEIERQRGELAQRDAALAQAAGIKDLPEQANETVGGTGDDCSAENRGAWPPLGGASSSRVRTSDTPDATGGRDPTAGTVIVPEEAQALIKALLHQIAQSTCLHQDRERRGGVFTYCNDCGREWSDEDGGFQPHVDSYAVTRARSLLAQQTTGDAP